MQNFTRLHRFPALLIATVLLLTGCVGTPADPDPLRFAQIDSETRIGVMAYLGRPQVMTCGNVSLGWHGDDGLPVTVESIGRLQPVVADPREELGRHVSDLLIENLGVQARPVRTSVPRGNHGDIARTEAMQHGLDAILFVPVVAKTHCIAVERLPDGSQSSDRLRLRHEAILHAHLWSTSGELLWDGELGRSDAMLGGYRTFESETTVGGYTEFMEELAVGFDDYMNLARVVAETIVEDIAEDTM